MSHWLYGGEWVRTTPMMSKRFVPVDPACELCRRVNCAPAWHSIKTRRVRCDRCFQPEGYTPTHRNRNGMTLRQ